MKSISILAAIATLSLGGPALAGPFVEIRFVNPDAFTDATPSSYSVNMEERDAALVLLREHLLSLGAKFLKDNDRLKVEILDLDLAGVIEPSRVSNRDVRVLRDITVPRIHLRYKLSRGGVESSGEERLAELNYLRESTRCRTGEPLCHERLMLERWFARRILGTNARPAS